MERKALFTISLVLTFLIVVSMVCSAFVSIPVKKISLSATSLTLSIGESYQFKATITPANATSKTLKWYSSDNKTVGVDGKGNIKALKTGKAFITAKTADGKVSASCNVKVVERNAAPTVITVLTSDPGVQGWSLSQKSTILREMERILNIEVRFEATALGDQYTTLVNTRMAAGTNLPDVIQWTGEISQMLDFAKSGVIIDLTKLIQNSPNIKKRYYDQFPKYAKMLTAPDGKIYSISSINEWTFDNGDPVNSTNLTWIMRKDWLDAVGIQKIPETVDEFYQALKLVHEKDANKNNKKDEIAMLDLKTHRVFGQYFGVPFENFYPDENGKVIFRWDVAGAKEYIQYANKLYREQLIDSDSISYTGQKQMTKLTQNKLFGQYWYNYSADTFNQNLADAGFPGAKHVAIDKPLKRASGKTYQSCYLSMPSAGDGYVITKNCKHPEEVMKWFDFLFSDKGAEMRLNCIEGVHSVRGKDGKLTLKKEWLDKFNDPKTGNLIAFKEGLRFYYIPFCTIQNYDEFLKTYPATDAAKETYHKLARYPDQMTNLVLPILSNEENEKIRSIGSDAFTYCDEMISKFIIGDTPISEWDNFQKKYRSMGINDLKDLYQKAYDRYRNTR